MTGSFSRRQILAAAGSAPLLFFGGPVLAGKSTKYTGEGVHQGVRQIVLVSVSITTSGRITTRRSCSHPIQRTQLATTESHWVFRLRTVS
jgi:hypothetical protein